MENNERQVNDDDIKNEFFSNVYNNFLITEIESIGELKPRIYFIKTFFPFYL